MYLTSKIISQFKVIQILFNDIYSQLYRSGSFNSSGMGSNYDPAEDMYSDVSLEEMIDLSHKVSKTVSYVLCLMFMSYVLSVINHL